MCSLMARRSLSKARPLMASLVGLESDWETIPAGSLIRTVTTIRYHSQCSVRVEYSAQFINRTLNNLSLKLLRTRPLNDVIFNSGFGGLSH